MFSFLQVHWMTQSDHSPGMNYATRKARLSSTRAAVRNGMHTFLNYLVCSCIGRNDAGASFPDRLLGSHFRLAQASSSSRSLCSGRFKPKALNVALACGAVAVILLEVVTWKALPSYLVGRVFKVLLIMGVNLIGFVLGLGGMRGFAYELVSRRCLAYHGLGFDWVGKKKNKGVYSADVKCMRVASKLSCVIASVVSILLPVIFLDAQFHDEGL
ncbi:hypothetical protein EI94DRAFT_1706327 [Lactarius quietus]|nr:hypothetical protein EI94DRAFT_1706327 [Lactarius quietus]